MAFHVQGGFYCPPSHWLGEDGLDNRITIQGNVLTWKVLKPKTEVRPTNKRGSIRDFTDDARLRMLKYLGSVDLEAAMPAIFMSLTYPPEIRPTDRGEVNRHRSVFWRYIEKLVGKKVSAIWRTEWLPRKSGKTKGQWYPHFHLVVFNTRWIACKDTNRLWKKTLGWERYCRTETKRAGTPAQAAHYVAKYCAKLPDSSLVNPAYEHIAFGKHWGILRPEGVPRFKLTEVRLPRSDELDYVREFAANGKECTAAGTGGSFTVLGTRVGRIGEEMKRMGLIG